jgi:GntR family phosphonate transport system transcriptional regulator
MAPLPRVSGCRVKPRSPKPTASTVETPRLAYPLRSRTRFSEIVGAGGREPRGQLIGASEEPATRELARRLGLKTGTPLLRIEALRSADRTPICVGTTWLAAERFPEAGRIYERVRSTTKLLAHYGIRDYRRASTHVTAAIVNATDAVRLNLALGRPILVVESTDVDANGKPLLTTRARFAAERIEFVVENT